MINITEIQECIKNRLEERRYEHCLGVAEVARELALTYQDQYDLDTDKAYIAGLLHDWDKCYAGTEIFERAHELGMSFDEGAPEIEKILHAHTAAIALKTQYPELTDDVLDAIDSHTLGKKNMSALGMVLYLADYIDPSRKRIISFVPKIKERVGKLSLEELVYMNLGFQIIDLVERNKPIFPQTIEAYNSYQSIL